MRYRCAMSGAVMMMIWRWRVCATTIGDGMGGDDDWRWSGRSMGDGCWWCGWRDDDGSNLLGRAGAPDDGVWCQMTMMMIQTVQMIAGAGARGAHTPVTDSDFSLYGFG